MSPLPELVCLLLAAGHSTRFGGSKLDAALPPSAGVGLAGQTVFECSYRALGAAQAPVFVASRIPRELPRCSVFAQSERGMGASLAAALRAALDEFPTAQGVLVMLADLPYVQPQTVWLIAQALRDGADLVAPEFEGQRGHPMGISRRHFAALLALDDDKGAKALLGANPVLHLPVDDPGCVHDVDTPDRLAPPR